MSLESAPFELIGSKLRMGEFWSAKLVLRSSSPQEDLHPQSQYLRSRVT
jgi:hypothetical protein